MTGELELTAGDGSKKAVLPVFIDGKSQAEPGAPDAQERPLSADAPAPVPAFSRREALANLALDAKSRVVPRAVVNRVWRQLMGRGLVEPVDMMHEQNAPTHPVLLDLLADDFATHGSDLRRLMAVILASDAYGRSSQSPSGNNDPDGALYAVAQVKPLSAEQLALSLPLATGGYDDALSESNRNLSSLRASAHRTELVTAFDSPSAEFDPTAGQALYLLNSEYVQKHFIRDSRLASRLIALEDEKRIAVTLYMAVLSRSPTEREAERVKAYLVSRTGEERIAACHELIWALIAGAEFRFNH
jgi:hypothetical protein